MPEWIRKHRSKIAAAVAVALFGVAIGGVISLGVTGGGEDPGGKVRADARHLHCLDVKQRPALVRTAIRLGEAAPGSTEAAFQPMKNGRPAATTTLDKWSRGSPESFARACKPLAVLTGAKALQDPAPKPSLLHRIGTNPLFTLVLGALLTFTTTWSAARTARRQSLADQLNTAAADYLKAADGVRRARFRGTSLDETALEDRQVELWSAILRVPLPPAQSRGLLRRLEGAHRTLKEDEFDNARTLAGLQDLSGEVAKAVRGERVAAGEAVEAAASASGGGR